MSKKLFTFIVARPTTSVSTVKGIILPNERIKVFTTAQIIRNKGILIDGIKFKLQEFDCHIKRNRIQCKKCNSVIESLFFYHRVYCSCFKCSVDGGTNKLIRTGVLNKDYKELSEYYND
jgi:hypothetical protein